MGFWDALGKLIAPGAPTPSPTSQTAPAAFSAAPLRYLIAIDGAIPGNPGEIYEMGYDGRKPARGRFIQYGNLYNQTSLDYGPYLGATGTAAQYGEKVVDPHGAGWSRLLGDQISKALANSAEAIEWDNPDGYDQAAVLNAVAVTAQRGLNVIAKNPLACSWDCTPYVAHPTVVGIVVEKDDEATPAAYDALRKRVGKPELPIWFVAFKRASEDGRAWATFIASDVAHYRNMWVTYSPDGEYTTSIDIGAQPVAQPAVITTAPEQPPMPPSKLANPIIDTPDTVIAKLSTLKAAGVTGIIRYDDPSDNAHSWKQVSDAEYSAILAAGLSVGIVSEWGNNHDGYFSAAAGTRDAKYSLRRARDRGQPKGSAIYFAVDYDVSSSAMGNLIMPFFKAIKQVIGDEYRIGVYGSGFCCESLKTNHFVDLTWITCSSGFNGSKAYVNAGKEDLWQVFGLCDQTYQGLSVDWDRATGPDWGQVTPGGQIIRPPLPPIIEPPKPVPAPDSTELHDLGHRIKRSMLAQYPQAWFPEQNVISVEGMDPDGRINANRPNAFDDFKCVIDGDGKIIGGPWEGTTQPGVFWTTHPMADGGAFIIALGPQKCWTPGDYHGPAWRQAEDSVIYGTRDPNCTYKRQGPPIKHGNIGVHHHKGYDLPRDDIANAAAGCQVIRLSAEHLKFMAITKACPRFLADGLTATVLEAKDILP